MDNQGLRSRDELLLEKLRQIVLENLQNEQFSVEELSQTIGVSRSQLHRKLKKLTKKSISQFIREIRLEKALELLRADVASVSEIAYQVGFSSPTYFNSSFRNYFGYPPGEAQLRSTVHTEKKDFNSDELKHEEKDRKLTVSKRSYTIMGAIVIAISLITYYGLVNTSPNTKPLIEKGVEPKSIAVLPLMNLSGSDSLDYVGDGITDDIIRKIARMKSLEKVIPFVTMQTYKNTKKVITEIAQEQEVTHVLQGSFQLSGNQMMIKLQLIEGESDKQIWDNEFSGEWKSSDLFSIQNKVARNVISGLGLSLEGIDSEILKKNPTNNPEAANLFMKAEYQRNKFTRDSFEKAIPLYQKAIEIDSNMIRAYAGLAQVYLYRGLIWGVENEEEAWGEAKKLLVKAFEVDPNDNFINGQLYNGYLYYEWNFVELQKRMLADLKNTQFDRVTDLTYDYKIKMGFYDEALLTANARINAAPDGNNYGKKAELLFVMDELELCEKLLAENDPLWDDGFYLRESAKWYFYLNNLKASQKQLEKYKAGLEDRPLPPIVLWLDAVHAERRGDQSQVVTILNTLKDRFYTKESGSPAWFIALYYAYIGDSVKCLEWLNQSYKSHEVEMIWLRAEPLLKFIHCEPEYFDLYRRVGFLTDPPCEFKDNQVIQLEQ